MYPQIFLKSTIKVVDKGLLVFLIWTEKSHEKVTKFVFRRTVDTLCENGLKYYWYLGEKVHVWSEARSDSTV